MLLTDEERTAVNKKNDLICELNEALKVLDEMKIDRLCDARLIIEVKKHPALIIAK